MVRTTECDWATIRISDWQESDHRQSLTSDDFRPNDTAMAFRRNDTSGWHRAVPGARWFKADLHVHTIDDHPGRRAKLPAGVNGAAESADTIATYARRFLQSAVARGVRVLGITPHAIRAGNTADTSAVWRIVEEWNAGSDDGGVPFREQIYAIFPGFEPSLKQGRSGLHLLFLFDPEIGRERYFRAFDLVMGTTPSPWQDNRLQLSSRSADEALGELRGFHAEAIRAGDSGAWDYITLAPHIDNDKGLLGAQKAQVLQRFEHGAVAGLELGDDSLPEDALKDRRWLEDGMDEHRQAFFHGSDAYRVDDIGRRHTWLKLATARIESLRQAFIASDSRIRLAYERSADGCLHETPAPPDVTVNARPWLKSVTVTGRASFFDGARGAGSRFELSPDLTCIIGGSMTGKSTLLDGLRVHLDAPLPHDDGIRSQVAARGRDRFLGGSPEVTLDCPGQDPTAPPDERWPAVFYAQNELQRLAQDPGAVQDILVRLVAPETDDILAREERLSDLDRELALVVTRLAKLDDDIAVAEQALERCRGAAAELAAFSDAGITDLHRASRSFRGWQDAERAATELATSLSRVLQSAGSVETPGVDDIPEPVRRTAVVSDGDAALHARWQRIRDHLRSARNELSEANASMGSIVAALQSHESAVRVDVERKLAERGVDGARLKEFQSLSGQASLLASYEANFAQTRDRLDGTERTFEALLAERRHLIEAQRAAFDRVTTAVGAEPAGRISARRIDDGDREPLEQFVKGLNQRGVTRWWNDLADRQRPSPRGLLAALEEDRLASLGMSEAVQKTFRDALSRSRRRALAAIRCRDRYVLEFRMDDGTSRRLDDLSGGQRVSVLLSLLLKTHDDRPLVIDQPEDELDNRFLFDTVLPALKRLKGRRQIVVATHNANIVVNGDADQVIQLAATADRGRVAAAGAIEDPAVRDAIVRTVDGGDDAFRLRRLKYGF